MKALLTKAHWLIGITLGTFLAISGLTGAFLAFGPEMSAAASGINRSAEVLGNEPLPIGELYRRLQDGAGAGRIMRLTVFADPRRLAQVQIAEAGAAAPVPGASPPSTRAANPYSGELLPQSRLSRIVDSAQYWTREFHQGHWFGPDHPLTFIPRWGFALAAFSLFFIALSGLYLRWPAGRSARTWQGWLKVDNRLKGRAFLRNLHVVIGTLVLLMYLVTAHTGTMQAAPMRWYDTVVRAALDVAPLEEFRPPPPGGVPEGGPGGPGSGGPRFDPSRGLQPAPSAADLQPLIDRLIADVPDYEQATIDLGFGKPSLTYVSPDGDGRISISPQSGTVETTPMPGERSFAQALVDRNQEIHEGRILGLPGVTLMMFAALAMPGFYVTGWMMYLKRRRRERKVGKQSGDPI